MTRNQCKCLQKHFEETIDSQWPSIGKSTTTILQNSAHKQLQTTTFKNLYLPFCTASQLSQIYSQGELDCLLELIQCAHLCLTSHLIGIPSISCKHCQSIQTSGKLSGSSGMAQSWPPLQSGNWLLSPVSPRCLMAIVQESLWPHIITFTAQMNTAKYNHSPSFHVFDMLCWHRPFWWKRGHSLWCYQYYLLMAIFSVTESSNVNTSYTFIRFLQSRVPWHFSILTYWWQSKVQYNLSFFLPEFVKQHSLAS